VIENVMAVVVLLVLPAIVIGLQLLPAHCWIRRAIEGIVQGANQDDGAGDEADPES
jgi:hypothetical protein